MGSYSFQKTGAGTFPKIESSLECLRFWSVMFFEASRTGMQLEAPKTLKDILPKHSKSNKYQHKYQTKRTQKGLKESNINNTSNIHAANIQQNTNKPIPKPSVFFFSTLEVLRSHTPERFVSSTRPVIQKMVGKKTHEDNRTIMFGVLVCLTMKKHF